MSEEKIIHIDLKEGLALRMKTRIYAQTENDEPIDLDRLLMIDVVNLEAELVTFPVVLNMLGLALADATNRYNEAKVNLEVYEAKFKEDIYNQEGIAAADYEEDEETSKRKRPKFKKYTVDQIDAMVKNDKVFQVRKRTMYRRQKEMEYLNSIYWSAKSKDDKLNRLSTSIKAGDVYDALAASKLKQINNVDMRLVKPLIQ